MQKNAFFTIIVLLTLARLPYSLADCNRCQTTNYVACHSKRVYSLCTNGFATDSYIECPSGTVCSDDPYICRKVEFMEPSCALENFVEPINCNICASENKVFSCLNDTTIAFCFGQDTSNYNALAYCPANTVCDLNNSIDFCSPANQTMPSCHNNDADTTTNMESSRNTTLTTQISITTQTTIASETTTTIAQETTTFETTLATEPAETTTTTEGTTITPETTTIEETTPEATTTLSTTTTTTTPKPTTTTRKTTTTPKTTTEAVYYNFCSKQNQNGMYPNVDDPTCQTFIYCVKQNNLWIGAQMYCDYDVPYFDSSESVCTATKPSNCL